MIQTLDSPVQYIKGIGPHKAQQFEKLGIKTIEDLIYYLPWRYEDRSQLNQLKDLRPGLEQTVLGWVKYSGTRVTPRKRFSLFELIIEDSTGFLKAIWFNQPFLKEIFKKDKRVVLSGPVTFDRYDRGRLLMENPRYEFLEEDTEELIHTGRIVPIYHETFKLTSRQIRVLIRCALHSYGDQINEILPVSLREKNQLVPLLKAIELVHFPEKGMDIEALNHGKSNAHQRLIFDELFLLELGLAIRRKVHRKGLKEKPLQTSGALVQKLIQALPFTLTQAQQRVIHEIHKDMSSIYPMNRLIQGDVGCGKTIVAIVALMMAVENGSQGVLMAPTEILAEQHFLTLRTHFDHVGIKIEFLTSRVKKKERGEILKSIRSGKAQVVIGTHSLIQEDVSFSKLSLAIIDEQHKFGVMQRALLRRKGYHPDILIMTATPIPRTLALSVYGDLDISIIDQLPPGRSPIQTKIVYESQRSRVYQTIHHELEKGRQAYVVVPLIEESEKIDLKAAVSMAKTLQEDVFPQRVVGLLHGRMPPEERGAVMKSFKERKINLLVTTTVIEVGIDVSNASVMLIDHAERFGLSQLHQLRGRIGRGPHPSICLLLAHYPLSEDAKMRLSAMAKFQDGFSIAEEDLSIRGPGDFLGTRQSGIPELRLASIIRDVKILEKTREEAFHLLEKDPDLSFPYHQGLRKQLEKRWQDKLELMNMG